MSEPTAAKRPTSKAVAIGLVVLGGGFALIASVQEWLRVDFLPGVATAETLSITGQKLNPALTLIALAGLASALVLTIAGRGFRRVIGVLVLLLGIGLAVLGAMTGANPVAGARKQIEEVSGIAGEAQEALLDGVTVSAWPGVTIAVGALLALGGVLILVFGGRWKTGGRKYESGDASPKSRGRVRASGDRISEWDALSDGDDPTDELDEAEDADEVDDTGDTDTDTGTNSDGRAAELGEAQEPDGSSPGEAQEPR